MRWGSIPAAAAASLSALEIAMTAQNFEDLLDRKPFVSFRLFLSNGDQFDVTQRVSVAVGRNGLFIVLPDDRWKWIPIRHITSVETLQAA